jgi:hypothetical protein
MAKVIENSAFMALRREQSSHSSTDVSGTAGN